ncbi:MAG: hypothetical protein ACRDHP_01810, partial [Ktedonobacterales bacterium]
SSTVAHNAGPRRSPLGLPRQMSPGVAERWNRSEREDSARPRAEHEPVGASPEWWRAARVRARTSMTRSPSGAMRFARRWSPGIVPPLLSVLLLLGALALAGRSAPHQQPLVAPQTLFKLLVTYLVAGTLYGFVLYFAASDVVWLCLLAVGVPTYLVLTLGILWGPVAAGVALSACVALAVWYVRRFTYAIPDGKLAVTTVGGGYARTVWQGRLVLAPGEHVAAALDAHERRFTCPARRADIPNELGEIYQARASATVSYQLIPLEAHNAVLASSQWERDLHEQSGEALTQALGEWGAHLLMGDDTPPEQLLAKTLLRELREQVRPRGIHVGWVSVRDIWLAPEGELLPADDLPAAPLADDLLAPGAGSQPIPLAALRQDDQDDDMVNISSAQPSTSAEDDAEPADALSADVLSDAYEAVREWRITD